MICCGEFEGFSDEFVFCMFTVTRDRRIDLEKKQTGRSVFLCRVFGPRGVGKVNFFHRNMSLCLQKFNNCYRQRRISAKSQPRYI
jgi:hypothetical protein